MKSRSTGEFQLSASLTTSKVSQFKAKNRLPRKLKTLSFRIPLCAPSVPKSAEVDQKKSCEFLPQALSFVKRHHSHSENLEIQCPLALYGL